MGFQLVDLGEEAYQYLLQQSSNTVKVTLYADTQGPNGGSITGAVDVADGDDIAAVTSEPSGSAYARQTVTNTNITIQDDGSSNAQIDIPDVTFDVSDSSQEVNAYAVTIEFPASVFASDGGTPTEHLFFTGQMDSNYDLSQFNSTVDFADGRLTLN